MGIDRDVEIRIWLHFAIAHVMSFSVNFTVFFMTAVNVDIMQPPLFSNSCVLSLFDSLSSL